MRDTKTKMIIIIASIIAVTVIVLLICIFALPQKKESKQEDLWEYVFSGNIQNVFQSYFTGVEYNEVLKDKKYETTTNISFEGNIAENEELNTHLKNLEINATGNVNNQTKQAMGNVVVNYLKNQMFKLDYIRDDQSFGIKSDEVVNMYLGIKNNDLDLLAEKLGLSIDLKQIELINYKDFLLDSETIELLKKDVKNALLEQISTDKFSKQSKRTTEVCGNQVTVDSYTLMLNDEETYKILVKVLEKISEDETLIENLAPINSVLSKMGMESNIFLKESIQSYIQGIESKTFSQNQMIMATIYVLNGKMVKLDVSITQDGKNSQYILEALESSNTMNLVINNQENENVNTTEISISKSEKQVYTVNIKNTENNKENINIVIQTQEKEGSLESGSVTNIVSVQFIYGDINLQIKLVNKINVLESIEIENLNSENCAFVNDMDKERIQYLYSAIIERIVGLYNEKMEVIESGQLQEITKPVNQEVQSHNAEFEMYEGEFAGNIVVELLNKAINSNIVSEYKIALKTKLTKEDETNLSETEITVDNLQPIANLLEESGMYTITLHYHPVSGAIDEITIVKSGIQTEEEQPQVVIPDEQQQ